MRTAQTRRTSTAALLTLGLLSGPALAATVPPGGTLTVALGAAPASLDPSSGEASNEYYFTPAYDSLIDYDYDGKYKPNLATAWAWVGTNYKVLDLTLRPNVKFSDGSTLTAQTVKSWLDLQAKNKSPVAVNLGTQSVQVTGPLKVRLTMAASNPLALLFLSRTWLSGAIPCAKASANPAILKSATCGSGPYILDAKQTVTGDTYTYLPNPNYWNPRRVQWKKLVLKVVANPQAALDAVRAGQAQVAWPAQASLIPAALSAGLKSAGVPQNILGLDFLDKSGKVVPALKDVRVRQALNHAIDRTALAAALGGGQGSPVSSQFLQGADGYDASLINAYPYDVARAKQLLASAGYAQGFDLTILSTPIAGLDTLMQAVSGYWQAVGVRVKIDNKTQGADFFAGLTSGKYGVAAAALGATNPSLLAWNCCFQPGTVWNPDKTPVPQLTTLVDKLRVTDPTKAAPVARQINSFLTKNAWFAPVYSGKLNYVYDGKKVALTSPSGVQPVINILDFNPVR
ncbi:ABC transporter substrate-binding protein [Deinococcus gobiensis]|uniref:Putative ABC-type dipeptide transport system,periplasmic component n=1 Tax=Deinococcus gobiensis (strain DSM 21396 / JCM 16679 / CGMCC 1.7299 / I-0) TaxID=745776 RepID=H8H0K5_DEIGI|nr:ABC transporter substrate-binding protein [Deinococcus gobiensis]AFD27257.1 Putative ABC-type dipeptide transport system,periplasmic component [Deinococcus gobiensis I-0]